MLANKRHACRTSPSQLPMIESIVFVAVAAVKCYNIIITIYNIVISCTRSNSFQFIAERDQQQVGTVGSIVNGLSWAMALKLEGCCGSNWMAHH